MNTQDVSYSTKPNEKWVRRWSKSKPGKCYYFNAKTRTTSWTVPEGAVVEEATSAPLQQSKVPLKRQSKHDSPTKVKRSKLDVQESVKSEKKPTLQNDFQGPNDIPSKLTSRGIPCALNLNHNLNVLPSSIPHGTSEDQYKSSQVICFDYNVSSKVNDNPQKLQPLSTLQNTSKRAKKRKRKKAGSSAPQDSQCLSKNEIKSSMPCSSSTGNSSEMNLKEITKNQTNCTSESLTQSINISSKNQARCASRLQDNATYVLTPQNDMQVCSKNNKQAFLASNVKGDSQSSQLGVFSTISNSASAEVKVSGRAYSCGARSAEARLRILQAKLLSEQRSVITSAKTQTINHIGNVKRIERNVVPKATSRVSAKEHERLQQQESKVVWCNEVRKQNRESSLPAASRLAQLRAKLQSNPLHREISNQISVPDQKINPFLLPASSCNKLEEMDIEYIESEVLIDISKLRQTNVVTDFSQPIGFMDVDIDHHSSSCSSVAIPYVVLDTNILLSHLNFVEGLRDTVFPGNLMIHLYLPWQVLHELDHLKDRGKSNIQALAQRAIKFLHYNFSSKHPRVHGQKLQDANQNCSTSPDDNILQSCITLKERGYTVLLLSNDINLLNKALVSDLVAVSKDQFVHQFQEKTVSTLKSTFICEDKTVNKEISLPIVVNDEVFCQLKTIIKDTLTLIVSQGMENVFEHLWKKRTLIPPPWEVDDVLHCLGHHWFSICGYFIPASVRETIEKLRCILRIMSKGCGSNASNLRESFDLFLSLLEVIPKKDSDFTLVAAENVRALQLKVNQNTKLLDPKSTTCTKLLGDQCSTVLLCFEQALCAAQSLCSAENFSDSDWIERAQCMLVSVRRFLNLVTLVLSMPIESLNGKCAAVVEITSLIKGDNYITEDDVAYFCKQDHNRTLMQNGILQFISIEELLSKKLQFHV